MSQANEFISKDVVPAIMPQNFDQLHEEMQRFLSLVPMVQIDVMDGNLTPSKSWPYKSVVDGEFLKIVNQEEGFPFWEHMDFEADLMVTDPVRVTDQWIAAGAARIIVHFESAAPAIIAAVLTTIKDKGIEAGLAVGLETAPEAFVAFYESNKDSIDLIQFMGIEKIGFQGQPFDERVLERIVSFKEKFPDVQISVDGGVNADSAPRLAEAGVSRLVVGSALAAGAPLAEIISHFDSLLKKS
jgi:ribulose-phosphate 3-epimerase